MYICSICVVFRMCKKRHGTFSSVAVLMDTYQTQDNLDESDVFLTLRVGDGSTMENHEVPWNSQNSFPDCESKEEDSSSHSSSSAGENSPLLRQEQSELSGPLRRPTNLSFSFLVRPFPEGHSFSSSSSSPSSGQSSLVCSPAQRSLGSSPAQTGPANSAQNTLVSSSVGPCPVPSLAQSGPVFPGQSSSMVSSSI